MIDETATKINLEKECPYCHRKPTPEGRDACLGYMIGVKSACCGHGGMKKDRVKNNPFIIYSENNILVVFKKNGIIESYNRNELENKEEFNLIYGDV